MTLVSFSVVSRSGMKTGLRIRRAISLATLLFVFFLPLHFHVSLASQVSKECSCVHGTRAQLALHGAAPAVTPTLQVAIFAGHYQFSGATSWSELPSVLGPPTGTSV